MPPAVDESWPLGLCSPYGCSKGAADAYVLDYARVFGLRTVVFRMSCLYGPRQFGTEDQGWVAHFLLRALRGEPITIYGDGRQVRDLLYIDDAVDAYMRARARIGALAGQVFNLGGGPRNAVSLLELLARFAELGIAPPPVRFADWRPGDQRYYVSDTSKFERLAGWRARTSVTEGLRRLHRLARRQRPGVGTSAPAVQAEMCPSRRSSSTRDPGGFGMRAALLNPRWSFEGSIYFGCRDPHLPLEHGYTKALLEARGHEVLLLDAHLLDLGLDEVRAELRAFRPDMTVLTTAPTYLFWRCPPPELRVPQQLAAAVRDVAGVLVAVGPHGSATPGPVAREARGGRRGHG